jgi:hypothetical protein
MKSFAVGLAASRFPALAVMTRPLEFDIYQQYLSGRRHFRQFLRQHGSDSVRNLGGGSVVAPDSSSIL